ncbi:MAG: DUF177 domain-containing protein [Thermoanaerobaculia bacterium]
MLIQLDQIGNEPFHWEESPSISAESLGRSELSGVGGISWSGRVVRDLAGYRLEARLSYQQTLTCTRCLQSLARSVEEEFELAIETGASEPLLGEHELSASDLKTLFLEGQELDTTPILMEQLQLNIPMKPLCREDCAGLCPKCGTDRNEVRCSCAESEVDPRWQALERFRQG